MPPLLNDFIALQKDVALVSILGPLEAFRVAQIEAVSNFNYTPLLAAALLYLCVTIPLARLLDHCEREAPRGDAPRRSRSAASRRPTASARCCAASTSPSPSTRRSR